ATGVLMVAHVDGTMRRALSLSAVQAAVTPVWMPDGKLLAAVAGAGANSDLLEWDPAADQRVALLASAPNIRNVAVSPDGRAVLFTSGDPGSGDLSKYDFRAAANKLSVVANSADDEDWGSFSPDGTQIAFTVAHQATLAAPDGTAARRLTNSSGAIEV